MSQSATLERASTGRATTEPVIWGPAAGAPAPDTYEAPVPDTLEALAGDTLQVPPLNGLDALAPTALAPTAPAASTRTTVHRPPHQKATWVTAGIGIVTVLVAVLLMAYSAPGRSSAPASQANPAGAARAPHGPTHLQGDFGPRPGPRTGPGSGRTAPRSAG